MRLTLCGRPQASQPFFDDTLNTLLAGVEWLRTAIHAPDGWLAFRELCHERGVNVDESLARRV